MRFIPVLFLICVTFLNAGASARERINVVPVPDRIEYRTTAFSFSRSTIIECDRGLDSLARYLSRELELYTHISPAVHERGDMDRRGMIVLRVDREFGDRNPESYELDVSVKGVVLKSGTEAGIFRGIQTLLQLVPISDSPKHPSSYRLPGCRILDHPRFAWRGVNLDCVRHFMSVAFVKKVIDLMSLYKFNVFHWHLTDDQGWRIEIRKYPKLTEVGAWRKGPDDSLYGGYYTQEEIRDVVDYARRRFVTVVPEIEMPGHCTASLAAYPENSCGGAPVEVGTRWGVYDNAYCPARDSTYTFLENILNEVMDLFPSHYIHIGGDEVVKHQWARDSACQELIRSKGLDGVDGLQSYFVRKIQSFLASKGRQLVGWNEILEGGGPDTGAVIESWQGIDGAIQAVKNGCYAIVSPGEYTYLSRDPSNLPLDSVYYFNPVPGGLNPAERGRILGTEASVWSEHAPQDSVEELLFPRLLAVAEDAWSDPGRKNYSDFHRRLEAQYERLRFLGVRYGLEGQGVFYRADFQRSRKAFRVSLRPGQAGISILYSLDGQPLTLQSRRYQRPITISKTSQLVAQAEMGGRLAGTPLSLSFIVDRAVGARVTLADKYSMRYSGGGAGALVDGIRATTSFNDGLWQGYHGTGLEATLDLKRPVEVSKIGAGFLQDENNWIFLPDTVEFFVSRDGKHFSAVGTVRNDIPETDPNVMKKDFTASFAGERVRYIRMIAKSINVCPSWHPGAGHRAWMFIDEIFAE